MKRKRLICDTCQVRGYSPDFCKLHQKKTPGADIENCYPRHFYRRVGKKAAIGAGVGVVAATVGLAVAPAVGLKVAIGHALAVKMTAGTGVAGAGINMARNTRRGRPGVGRPKKRGILLPLYLNKGA